MANQYGRGKQPSNHSKKQQTETRMFDNDSEESYEKAPPGEEFAMVVRNYREALARNDELLQEIELVKKNNIFAQAETKTAGKKLADLDSAVKKLQKQLKQKEEQATNREDYVKKLTMQIAELERQYIQAVDEHQLKAKQFKQELNDTLMQASIYREIQRVMKTVILGQYKNIRADQLDRLTDAVLEKYCKGKQLKPTMELVEHQHINSIAKDVRRALESFFIEVSSQKTQEIEQHQAKQQRERDKLAKELQSRDKANLELLRAKDELADSKTNYKKLQRKLAIANEQIQQFKRQFERVTSLQAHTLNRQYKQRSETLKYVKSQYELENRELIAQNKDLKETIRELTSLNNELRMKISDLRQESLRQTIFVDHRPPPSRGSRIRKNQHIRSVGRQVNSELSEASESDEGEYMLKRHLHKQTDLEHRYQQLKLEYEDTLDSFSRLLKSRERHIQTFEHRVTTITTGS